MPEVVLVRPGIRRRYERHWNNLPLGLAYLAAVARARGLSVGVVDGRLLKHASTEETARCVRTLAPRFVGISAMTVEFPRAADVASAVKRSRGGAVTILGGAHANAIPSDALAEATSFDYVVAGEAFNAFADLVCALRDGVARPSVPGICWRDAGEVRGPAGAAFLSQSEIETLPRPAWDLFPPSVTYPLITQLGCPFRCVFCCHNSTRKMRYRTVESVVDEVAWLEREHGAREIEFIDENFGMKADRARELLEALARARRPGRLRFSAQTRVDCARTDVLELMPRAGFEFLELGVESGDPDVLGRSGKDVDLATIEATVRAAKRVGLKVWLKFILGLPGETVESVRRTIRLAVKLNPDRLSAATIVPYPGSEIYRWARFGQNGYRLLSSNWNEYDKYAGRCLELDGISYRTLRRMQARIYIETLLRNRRFGELLSMAARHAAAIPAHLSGVVRFDRAS